LKNDETEDKVTEYRKDLRRIGIEVMNRAFDKSNVNILAVPADSGLSLLTSAAGTLPLLCLR
jgi:hypothetical protein